MREKFLKNINTFTQWLNSNEIDKRVEKKNKIGRDQDRDKDKDKNGDDMSKIINIIYSYIIYLCQRYLKKNNNKYFLDKIFIMLEYINLVICRHLS